MNSERIELAAHELHLEIYERREELGLAGVRPHRMCDPRVAAEILGLSYHELDTLGRFGNAGDLFEPAGTLDRNRRLIAVATKFPPAVRRFTAAHEIGHFLLHPDAVMHRDRPIFELTTGRPLMEREADNFAACFLAPTKVVCNEFAKRFGSRHPLPLNDLVAYHLMRDSGHELLNAPTGNLRFAIAVATASSFDSPPFEPLHTFFGISASAMAIRLRELRLVVD